MKKVLLFTLVLLCFSSFIYAREFTCETNEDCNGGKICIEGTCQEIDSDGDGIADDEDNCPNIPNPNQEDVDEDEVGNICDNCQLAKNKNQKDNDGDGVGNVCDSCKNTPNPNQEDVDEDEVGDICDNCPYTVNPDQEDEDDDRIGDECDSLVGKYDQDNNSMYLYRSMTMNLDNITVEVPAEITIIGGEGWTGAINAPTIQELATVPPEADAGYTGETDQVIEIGFLDVKLTFDKAVRITIPNAAGKLVGYSRDGAFYKITAVCAPGADQDWADANLAAEGDCKMDVDNNLVIWTKHFTEFVTYTQTPNPPSTTTTSGGGDSSCNAKWSCTDWSECINGKQTRECNIISLCGHSEPETVRSCACKEDWVCDDWDECESSGEQRRTCKDLNNCGMIADKPVVIKKCAFLQEGTAEVGTEVGSNAGEKPSGLGVTGMVTSITNRVVKNSKALTIISLLFGLGIIGYLAKNFLFKK